VNPRLGCAAVLTLATEVAPAQDRSSPAPPAVRIAVVDLNSCFDQDKEKDF
jgi:hypothetical protein